MDVIGSTAKLKEIDGGMQSANLPTIDPPPASSAVG